MNDTTTALPVEASGYETTRFNALRHGVLSRYAVLPWEDEGEYRPLLDALVAEHAPQGPTEEHLVEELAGILWRKRRLRLAEAAAYHRGLEGTLGPYRETVKAALVHLDATRLFEKVIDAIRATPAETAEDLADLEGDEAMTRRALDLLGAGKADAYHAALTALRARHWWEEVLARDPDELEEDQEPYTADAAGLLRLLEGETLPWYAMRRTELANRLLICAQAFGEALDPARLEQLGRYEVHRDRKLERMLTILIRLQNLRRAADPGLIRLAKLLPARVFLAEPYAGGQGQRGSVRLGNPRLPSQEHATVAFWAKGAKTRASTRGIAMKTLTAKDAKYGFGCLMTWRGRIR